MADGIQIDDEGVKRQLQSIDINNPRIQKDLRRIIGSVLRKARSQVSKDAKSALGSDPRQAYKAVRNSVYKQILGGQINILASRKASNVRAGVRHTRAGGDNSKHWGGNRMKRSDRTEQMDSYWGKDRGFILRFVNAGADERYAGRRSQTMREAWRGRISARNWFSSSSTSAMQKACEQLSELVDHAIKEVWNAG